MAARRAAKFRWQPSIDVFANSEWILYNFPPDYRKQDGICLDNIHNPV
jgi:hypothetical protein